MELLRPGSQVSGSTAPATQGNKTEEGDEESRDAAAIVRVGAHVTCVLFHPPSSFSRTRACPITMKQTLGALRSVPTLNDQKMGEMALQLSMADFEAAVEKVQPSATREGFGVVPDVTWADVGALKDVRSVGQSSWVGVCCCVGACGAHQSYTVPDPNRAATCCCRAHSTP